MKNLMRLDVETCKLPEIEMHGPIEVSLTVHVLTAEGKPARLTMVCGPGVIPTQWDLAKMLGACLLDGDIPAGTKFMTKPEFVAHITKRETGVAMPMPGNQEWAPVPNFTRQMLIHAILGRGVPAELCDEMIAARLAELNPDGYTDWHIGIEALTDEALLALYTKITSV